MMRKMTTKDCTNQILRQNLLSIFKTLFQNQSFSLLLRVYFCQFINLEKSVKELQLNTSESLRSVEDEDFFYVY